MKKIIFCTLFIILGVFSIFAGDVAEFVDLGFSEKGDTYFFAQYGLSDKDYYSYAEIYTVDVKNNAYVKGGVFVVPPSEKTANQKGKKLFEDLYKENKNFFDKYSIKKTNIDNDLYIKSSAASEKNVPIIVKDFEKSNLNSSVYYEFRIFPLYEESKGKCKGSFYITVDQKDKDGRVLSKKVVGNPNKKRDGVVKYSIEKIIRDDSGNNFVIVIEKQVVDSKGILIRYMVETFSYSASGADVNAK